MRQARQTGAAALLLALDAAEAEAVEVVAELRRPGAQQVQQCVRVGERELEVVGLAEARANLVAERASAFLSRLTAFRAAQVRYRKFVLL